MGRFDTIVILGSSTVACECVRALANAPLGLVVETKESQVSLLKTVAGKLGVTYLKITKKDELNAFLVGYHFTGRLLVISADNELLIGKEFIDRPNVEIINFHYGLLPDYRGMNIPSWVIYNGEKQTGVTWHYINANVDDGAIIAQESIPISEATTAFDIVRQTMRVGPRLFRGFIQNFLEQVPVVIPNVKPSTIAHEYKRRELPGGGVVRKGMSSEERSRLERAWNYGPFMVFPELVYES
jgi:methionyl-tRNA formyltransferase